MPPDPDAIADARRFLMDHGRDLTHLASEELLPPVWLRDADAEALIRELDRGRSVLLVGPDGVGRTRVVHAAATRLIDRSVTPLDDPTPGVMSLIELSTGAILAGTKYLGEWQTRLASILEAAETARVALYLTDLHNLPHAGRASEAPSNMLDQLRPWLVARRVMLVGEVSPARLRELQRVPGFVDLFVQQTVEPLPRPAVDEVLSRAAAHHGLHLPSESRKALVDLTDRFLPARPQPGPALDVLARVRDYQEQKAGVDEPEAATPAFVERVFSIYTGLPRFVVSRSATRSAEEIRAWFAERIVGQREAIDAVVQAIALFKSGLHDPRRPLGTFLFVGPTGVGKTELARAMAAFLFGSSHRLLRFDLGEFKDWASFERLLGSRHAPDEPALLVDAVRAQPFQVVLFDELEKAHPNVFDVLLSLLDEGRVTTPRGETLDLRSCFVVCTSNAGAQEGGRTLGFGPADAAGRRQRTLAALETVFRPELLNRFQHIVPFHPLDERQVRTIARQELKQILARDGITSRNLVVEVDDEALDLVVQHGFEPRWGARGLARELQRRIVVPLAMTLMEREVTPGQLLRVTAHDGHLRIRRIDTEASEQARREAEPIQLAGRIWTRPDLEQALRGLREDLEALQLGLDLPGLQALHAELLARRDDPAFWSDQDRAARELRDLDHVSRTLDRLDRLRTRVDDLATALAQADTRARLMQLAQRAEQLRTATAEAFRELLYMGRDGAWDALVEVRPLGDGRLARDHLVRMYVAWAEHRGMEVVWLHDPRGDDEPAFFAVRGPYAHGLLRLEAGVHRFRDGDVSATARVRVAPWTDRTRPVVFGEHRAIKGAIGTFGGRIRSRLVVEGGLVLQNGRTLAENRDLAVEIAGAWSEAPPPQDLVVRRYDLVAPLVRDVLTGESSGRPDATSPERLHELLCRRVEIVGQGPEAA